MYELRLTFHIHALRFFNSCPSLLTIVNEKLLITAALKKSLRGSQFGFVLVNVCIHITKMSSSCLRLFTSYSTYLFSNIT